MRAAARTQYRAGHFASFNALLNQSVRVVAPCQFTRGLQLIGSRDFACADGGTFEWWFDKQRQTQLRHNRVRVHLFATRKHHVFRRLQTVLQPNLLGAYLVHRQAAGQHATAGVRNTEQFQRTLHRAIFAKAAMQNNERTVKTFTFQVKQLTLFGIEQMRVHALFHQRRVHHRARFDRHFALGGNPAVQHRYFAQLFHVDIHHVPNLTPDPIIPRLLPPHHRSNLHPW